MKNVTILLAVAAVLALAVPAQGALVRWNGSITGDWHYNGGGGATDTNWVDYTAGTPHAIPGTADTVYVRDGGTVQITQAGDLAFNTLRTGYGSAGHVQMTGASSTIPAARYVEIGYGWQDTASTFIQSGGLNEAREIIIGANNGHGVYTISGGSIVQISAHTTFLLEVGNGTGTGRFNVMGTAPTAITVAAYAQNANSTLGITLASDGVRVITVFNDATLAGTLVFDATAYTGTATVIDILKAGSDGSGTLSYTGLSLDAASTAAGYSLGDDGNGMLQVTIPEPATMCLLAVGGIGVLIRRRRK